MAKYQADLYLFSALTIETGVCRLYLVIPEESLPSVLTLDAVHPVSRFVSVSPVLHAAWPPPGPVQTVVVRALHREPEEFLEMPGQDVP